MHTAYCVLVPAVFPCLLSLPRTGGCFGRGDRNPALFPLHSSGGRLPESLDDPLPVRAVPKDPFAADALPEAVVISQAPRRHSTAGLLPGQFGLLAAAGHPPWLPEGQAQLA